MRCAPFILNVHKPVGMTSAQVVAFFRGKFPRREFGKIGHLGTLDPFAEGVLLLGVAQATRLADWLHRLAPKSYRARGILGTRTDTGDGTGEVLERRECPPIDPGSLAAIPGKFQGEYRQRPPAFSAAKHHGRPLYRYARKGVFIDKPPVRRHIHALTDLRAPKEGELSFSCQVSSGTYIRTLFEDIARSLGQIGHLVELVRTEVGKHTLADSLPHAEWDKDREELLAQALSLPEALPLTSCVLGKERGRIYRNGRVPQGAGLAPRQTPCWVYGEPGDLIGLGELGPAGLQGRFNLPIVIRPQKT